MSEDDAREFIRAAFETLSHDNNDIKMSESVQSSIIQYIIEKQA